VAGLTDDDPDRFAYLAEGNAKQARKRVAADVLIRDRFGRIWLSAWLKLGKPCPEVRPATPSSGIADNAPVSGSRY
jgi:hypothetical protein